MLGRLTSSLYRAARIMRDVQVYASLDPVKILKRHANKQLIKKAGSKVRFN